MDLCVLPTGKGPNPQKRREFIDRVAGNVRAAAEIAFQNSCQSRFSGVYLVFKVFQESESKDMLAISYLVFGVFQDTGTPIERIPVYPGMLPCLVPSWPQIIQVCISFRCRSDLATNPWIFYPISSYRPVSRFLRCCRQEGRISVFALFASKCRCSCESVTLLGW